MDASVTFWGEPVASQARARGVHADPTAIAPLPRIDRIGGTLESGVALAVRTRWRGRRNAKNGASQCQTLLEWCHQRGVHLFSDLTRDMMFELIEHHELLGYQPASIQRKMACWAVVCSEAAEAGMWGDTKPFKVPIPKVPPKNTWWLQPEDAARLLPWLRAQGSKWLADYIAFVILTGVRVEEALRLRREHIHLGKQPWMFVPGTKTAKSLRRVSLGASASELATRILEEMESKDREARLFDRPYHHYQRAWKDCRTFLGETDPTCTLKSLRRTFSATATGDGMPVMILSEILGHSSVVTTQRYVRLTGNFLTEAARQWLR